MADEVAEAQVDGTQADNANAAEETVTNEISSAVETAAVDANEQGVEGTTDATQEEAKALAVEPPLYRRAVLAGLDDEAIADLGSPAAVERAIALLESRSVSSDASRGDAKGAPVTPPPPAVEVKDPEWKLDGLDGVDENIAKALKNVPQYVAEYVKAQLARQNPEVAALKEKLSGMENYVREVQQNQTNEAVDSWVSAQGADMEKVLGKGSFDELDPNSEGYKNRQKLYSRALIEAQVLAASGKRPPSLPKLLDTAKAVLFPQQVAKQERVKFLRTAQKAKGTYLARPSNKPGTPTEEDAEKQTLTAIESAISKS